MNQSTRFPETRRDRRGVASVMAMLFMVVFSAMALGFYAATVTSVQVAGNEKASASAQNAVESGVQFLRHHLSALSIPGNLDSSQIFDEIHTQLHDRLHGTANLGSSTVGYTPPTISIPQTGFIALDKSGEQKFRITLSLAGDIIVANVVGRSGSTSLGRGVEVRFEKAENASHIFNYGVASRGSISMSGNVRIRGATDPARGSVLAATASGVPLTTSGNTTISGDFTYLETAKAPSFSGTTNIGGEPSSSSKFADHLHTIAELPEFPTIDTSVYQPYCTNTWTTTTGNTVVNCVVPPNANPTFAGNVTVRGILFIRTPNRVTFSGNTTIEGCIVVENNPQGSNNTIAFSGNVTARSINTLPATSQFPPGERALTGAFLLAPRFAVTFSGNFGTIGGSLIADRFTFSGNAGGTIQGSVISLADLPLSITGNSTVTIASAGTTEYPPGVHFMSRYEPIAGSYLEVPVP